MSAEIGFDAGPGLTGITAYAILRNASQQVWNTAGAAFEAYNAANITDYDLALTEQGSSGYFVGDMPAVAAGLYTLTIKQQAGGSPAVSDTRIGGGEGDWNGTAFQSVANISSRVPTALVGGRMDSSVGAMAANVLTAAAMAADAGTEVATALLDLTDGIETGITPRQALRLMAAALAGELSGAATTTVTIKAADNNGTTRITATVDADGNRTALTLNP